MDSKKDNQLTSNQYSYEDVSFDIDTIGLFGDNHACAHAYKRTEKILLAIHLVTNLVPEKEPARKAIRDKSIHTLSDMLQLRSGFNSVGSEQLNHVVASVYEMISLLNILHVAGFVSDMNLEVLKRELRSLIVFLREAESTGTAEKVMINDDHFKTEKSIKGHTLKDSYMSFNKKDTSKKTYTNGNRHDSKKTTQASSRSERRSTILNLIKDKKTVNIKDISTVITDCSEKTLQRELISLVRDGVLKKEGERRWSVYSLL